MLEVVREVTYQSNFDYEASYEKLCCICPSVELMPKGCIRFSILTKAFKVWVLLSPKGKVQFAYKNEFEKLYVFMWLKQNLVPLPGYKEIILNPCHQNIYKIPYPAPKVIQMLWCDEETVYRKDYVTMGFKKLLMLPSTFLLRLLLRNLKKMGKF